MLRTAAAALAFVLAVGGGGPALAQRPPPIAVAPQRTPPAPNVRLPGPDQIRAAPRPSGNAIRAMIPPAQIVTFTVSPPPFANLQALRDMTGWTVLTNGATLGGPSVVRMRNGQGRIMVRASDSHLYSAPIDPTNPGGPIAGSAWVQSSLTSQSEFDCVTMAEAQSFADVLCGYLGPNGSANLSYLSFDEPQSMTEPLGGQGAGFRPTVVSGDWYMSSPVPAASWPGGVYRSYEVFVWTTGLTSFRKGSHMLLSGGAGGLAAPVSFVPYTDQWTQMASTYPTPYGCVRMTAVQCAVGTLNDRVRVVSAAPTPADYGAAPAQAYFTGPVPGGLSLNLAPEMFRLQSGAVVIVVRSKTGRVYSWSGNAWHDQGGWARDGSGISCLANNEQPVCFIQGDDGRIYWRAFATASGL